MKCYINTFLHILYINQHWKRLLILKKGKKKEERARGLTGRREDRRGKRKKTEGKKKGKERKKEGRERQDTEKERGKGKGRKREKNWSEGEKYIHVNLINLIWVSKPRY